MDNLINLYLPIATAIISLLAFIVSLITELIKDLSFMKKIPTNLVVIILSILLSVFAYIFYCSYQNCIIHWYNIIGSIFGGFIVAYIASYGWEKFHTLLDRFRKKQ